jgi:hypothetical protein
MKLVLSLLTELLVEILSRLKPSPSRAISTLEKANTAEERQDAAQAIADTVRSLH